MSSASASQAAPRHPEGRSAWQERSARLFEELRGPCAGMVRRAFGSTLGDHEIEDIYASAWVGTLRALAPRHGELDDEEIRKYVFTAVAHQASKELRRRRRKPVAPLERAEVVADGASPPDERVDQQEQSQITRDLLSSLPRRRRAVLMLRYGWGLEPSQVCELVEGLSPRAYRKEITRGVDQLTERIRTFESGGWCADREPVLKAFAAGIADQEQERQAQHHLAHCRHCADFVGKLSGHLHDLGSSVLLPSALDLAADGRISFPDRMAELADRARDSVAGVLARGGASAPESAASTLPASAPRGAGAAGAGALAKLAGLGFAGKAAVACIGGGAVAAVCAVAVVGPLTPSEGPARPGRDAGNRPERSSGPLTGMLSQVGVTDPRSGSTAGRADQPPGNVPEPEPEPEPTETAPPPAPGPVQQFGLAPAPSAPAASGGSSGDRAEASAQEFGP